MKKTKYKGIFCIILLFLFCITAFTPSAQATDTFHSYFFKKTVKLSFKLNSAFSQLSKDGFSAACAKWNGAAGYSLLSKSSQNSTTTGTFPKNNGENTVYRYERGGYPPGQSWAYRATDAATGKEYVVEGDIVINISCPFANSLNPPSGYYDTETVMLHELGHILSLAHPSDSYRGDTVMMASHAGTSKRNLTQIDIANVKTRLIP